MESLSPKQFVFVLMPFDESYNDLYNNGIKKACDDVGLYCERVDEQMFDGSILERIYNQIAKADVVVSEMSDRNPNVFYETGYAHALGKRVILMTADPGDIPFDLKHYPHIVHNGDEDEVRTGLSKWLSWAKEHPNADLSEADPGIELYSRGDAIAEKGLLWVKNMKSDNLQIDIFNPSRRPVSFHDYELSLIVEGFGPSYDTESSILMPDGKYIHVFPWTNEIFPQGWSSTKISLADFMGGGFYGEEGEKLRTDGFPAVVRMTTHVAIKEWPVTMKICDPI